MKKKNVEASARPLFPQWSHHVYPQFLPGSHPNHQNPNAVHHNHSNNKNMPHITTPSPPTMAPNATNMPQTVHNSTSQQSYHLHQHYHHQLHFQNSQHQQQQSQIISNQQRNNIHLNNSTATTTANYIHTRNRNGSGALHKNNALNNNNYHYRTNAGIVCVVNRTSNMRKLKKKQKANKIP